MQKSYTLNDLKKWRNNPINAGSIYIKPTTDNDSNYFGWFYYICCCGAII